MIRIIKQKIKNKIGLLCCVLFILFIFGCGGDDLENQVPSSESGSISFTVEWTEPSNSQNNYLSIYRKKPDPLDCQAVGIFEMEAKVYDGYDNYLISGGPWDCSLHSAIIDDIPAGLNRKIVILAHDFNGNIQYWGEATGITIKGGQTTDVGIIQTIFIDYSGIWNFTEQVIESMGECREEIGKQNIYSVQLEIMADGNASLSFLSHPEKPDMSDKMFIGEFKDNQLIVSSEGIAYNCGPNCSGTPCYNGQLAIDLTFLINDNATGTMRGDSCCGDGGYTIWSINAKRPIYFIDYYPLKIGNQWFYQGFYDGKEIEWLEYVSNQVTINENPAMKIEEVGWWNSPDYSWIDPDTGFWKFGLDEAGQEVRYDPPIIWQPIVEIGETYHKSADLLENRVKVGTKTDTIKIEGIESVTTPAGVFYDCLRIGINSDYFYDSNSSDYNDNFIVWFAKGIGEVKREDMDDGTYGELVWAVVDGKIYGATTDLAGDYWSAGFLHEKIAGTSINRCSLGELTFHGDGNYSYLDIFSEENTGTNLQDTGIGTYKVTQEGTIFFDEVLGKIQEGRRLLIASDVNDPNSCNIAIFAQKPLINNLNVSSLQGDYWHVGYAFDIYYGHKCMLSTYSFDGNGSYGFSQKFSEEYSGANQDYYGDGGYIVDPNGVVDFGNGLTGRIQEGGKLILVSDVTKPDSWRIDIITLKPSSGNFNNASLNGDYWRVDFSYNSDYGHRCALGVMTFHGDGNHSVSQIYSEENTGANLPYRETGTHNIESDGTITFDSGLIGKIQEGGDLITATNIFRTDEWSITIIVKKPVIFE